MEENLNEMVIENTINEVEENLTDEIIQNSTKFYYSVYRTIQQQKNFRYRKQTEFNAKNLRR